MRPLGGGARISGLLASPSRGPLLAAHAFAAKRRKRESFAICTAAETGVAPSTVLGPPIAETARTVVDISSHGTLCTLSDDGTPLGTYVTYVLDGNGQPVLKLREEAVHTANLRRSSRCSLFVHPEDYPARFLARVTLLGNAEAVGEDEVDEFRLRHMSAHGHATGVDRPRETDLMYRLKISKCFYVGGLSGVSLWLLVLHSGADHPV